MSGTTHPASATDRRSFFGKITGLIATTVAGVLGVTGGRFALYPAFRRLPEESGWQTVGPVDDLSEGEPVKRSVVVSQDGGWGRFNAQRLIWIVRDGAAMKVFTATCPHLGCTVNRAPNGFLCPCHGSAWTETGQRIGGPTLRSLDTLDYRIENGILKVKYQYFKQGISEKEMIF